MRSLLITSYLVMLHFTNYVPSLPFPTLPFLAYGGLWHTYPRDR
jgi:hypothetical protein